MIVSNTSPIINLASIGQLALLRQLYGTITIPAAVFQEIARFRDQPGSQEVQTEEWIITQTCGNEALAARLRAQLDAGEAEAITLAVEIEADLIIDERAGRQIAMHLGLDRWGLLEVLRQAKEKALIPAVRPLLDALRTEAGFWIGDALYHHVLISVDEST